MSPRGSTAGRRPALRNIAMWMKTAQLDAPSPLSNTGDPHLIHSQPWMSTSPSSLLVQYDHSTALLRDSVLTWYAIDNRPPRWLMLADGGHSDIMSTFSETIRGHTVALSNNGGLGIFTGRKGDEDVGEAQFQRIFTTTTQCPFVCPISGTVGYARSSGDIYVFRQK